VTPPAAREKYWSSPVVGVAYSEGGMQEALWSQSSMPGFICVHAGFSVFGEVAAERAWAPGTASAHQGLPVYSSLCTLIAPG
jgi:hypothetical protein